MAEEDAPFCLSISFKAPHRPVQPDPKFDHIYAGKKFPKPANYGREHGGHFSKQSTMGRQYERFSGWNYDKDYDGVMAKYHQQIYAIDVAVGMVRDALNKHGVADNTVIIYTSDNGFLCGSHGYGSKVLPYEEASRVPLLVFDPRHNNSGKRLRRASLTGHPCSFAPANRPAPESSGQNPHCRLLKRIAIVCHCYCDEDQTPTAEPGKPPHRAAPLNRTHASRRENHCPRYK
jgi:hypothetical protein